jgi:hypothetical protein
MPRIDTNAHLEDHFLVGKLLRLLVDEVVPSLAT